jgi:hypothetical protein
MAPANAWSAARDDADRNAGWVKRLKVRLFQWLPLHSLL